MTKTLISSTKYNTYQNKPELALPVLEYCDCSKGVCKFIADEVLQINSENWEDYEICGFQIEDTEASQKEFRLCLKGGSLTIEGVVQIVDE